jgi:SAM-dependent methyltransferase
MTRITVCTACQAELPTPLRVRYVKDGFEIAACPSCGLMFRKVLPAAEELAQIYDGSYFCSRLGDTRGQGYDDYLADAELHRRIARRRLDLLKNHASPGQLLDVGAAAGFFVAEATARGWHAAGIDVSEEMVQWGRSRLGASLLHTTLAQFGEPPGRLAAVTMWDYIEHAVDPRGDLERARDLLRPGGILALSTGDAASLVSRLSGKRWHLLTPRHHNYFFTADSLDRILGGLGFEIEYRGHPGVRYPIRYLTYKARTMIDIAPVRFVARATAQSGVGRNEVPINLGDIITIVARRSGQSIRQTRPKGPGNPTGAGNVAGAGPPDDGFMQPTASRN